jgi:hypothetical protein
MKKLTLEQEASVLHYIEYHRGKKMYGEQRKYMYDVYRFFKQDRDEKVCTCLDSDTHKKVDGFINSIDWSDEVRQSAKMQQLLPDIYVEPIQQLLPDIYVEPIKIKEVSTQPVKVNMDKLAKSIKKRKSTPKAKPVPVKPVRKSKVRKK